MDYRQDGFIFTKIPFENKEAVCIQSHRVPETIEYMKKKNIRYIKFHSDRYKHKGIKCLEEVAGQIEGIEIDMEVKDLSRIGFLHNLKYLSVTGNTTGHIINFANFPSLVECTLNWGGYFPNLSQCTNLKKLIIWNLEEPHLWELKDVHSLEHLGLYECLSLQDLEVIKPLVNLREVSLYNCRNLASIEQIKFMSGIRPGGFINPPVSSIRICNPLQKKKYVLRFRCMMSRVKKLGIVRWMFTGKWLTLRGVL